MKCDNLVSVNTSAVLAIVGSRGFNDYAYLCTEVDAMIARLGATGVTITTIMSGGAMGADRLGAQYARQRGLKLVEILPDWQRFGKRAGFMRNSDIVRSADYVVAFWDGESRGTKDSIDKARDTGKPVAIMVSWNAWHRARNGVAQAPTVAPVADGRLILVRGLLGSGKSTFARQFVANTPNSVMLEVDDYFMVDGKFRFQYSQLSTARAWCVEQARVAYAAGKTVVVANSFCTACEVAPYYNIAVPTVYRCDGKFPNVHGVTPGSLARMAARWESVASEQPAPVGGDSWVGNEIESAKKRCGCMVVDGVCGCEL